MFGIKRTNSNIVGGSQNPDVFNPSSEHLDISNQSNKRVPQLNMSRQDVYKEDLPQQQLEIHSEKKINLRQESKILISLKRSKVPAFLKQTLKKRALQSGTFKPKRSAQKVSNLTKSIFAKIRKQQITCGICIGVIDQKDIVKLCDCNHFYCKSCIRDYVAYKIKTFEQVFCPEEQCNSIMSQKTEFYDNLAQQIKKQYVKLHNFYVTSNDPSLKLCPKQDCQGIIKIKENEPWICGNCKIQFCPQCNFEKHEGNCDQKEIDFFQNNLHFRQCQNCKAIVEKTSGCNHMTCRCKYEFCYLCGQKWKGYDHVCNQSVAQIRALNVGWFQNGGALHHCNCDQTCGELFGCLLMALLRLVVALAVWIYLGVLLAVKLLLIAICFAGSILAGMVFYSIDQLCQACDNNCFLLIIFILLPFIPISIGIVTALRQIFCESTANLMEEYCEEFQRLCRNVCR